MVMSSKLFTANSDTAIQRIGSGGRILRLPEQFSHASTAVQAAAGRLHQVGSELRERSQFGTRQVGTDTAGQVFFDNAWSAPLQRAIPRYPR
jgi:hypothetical protein